MPETRDVQTMEAGRDALLASAPPAPAPAGEAETSPRDMLEEAALRLDTRAATKREDGNDFAANECDQCAMAVRRMITEAPCACSTDVSRFCPTPRVCGREGCRALRTAPGAADARAREDAGDFEAVERAVEVVCGMGYGTLELRERMRRGVRTIAARRAAGEVEHA